MATPEKAKAISGSTWTLIADYSSAIDKPRGYAVRNKASSANECEVFIVGIHGESAPSSEEGYSMAVGEAHSFFRSLPGGAGAIRAVYVKSAGATITHAIDVG